MSPYPFQRALLLQLLLLGASLPTALLGQEEVIPILRGEVRLGSGTLSEGTVILHQVSAEASGEIDSVRVDPTGSFEVRLPHVPDHATRPDIFFASVEHGGLLYFGEAVTEAFQLDSLYVIQAYDTLSVPVGGATLPLASRNLFLEKTADGWTATDVFLLLHEGDRTLFSPEEGIVWSYPLPPNAAGFQIGQGDLAPDAVRFIDNRVEVYSPLPPGERYLMIQYQIAEGDFVLPMPGRTGQMELLVREPAPAGEFPPLTLSEPVQVDEGSAFRRYAGTDLLDTEVRSILAPEPWSLPAEWLGLIVAGILGAAGVIGFRLRAPSTVEKQKGSGVSPRDAILVELATLDEEFQQRADPTPQARAAYHGKRSELLAQLKRHS